MGLLAACVLIAACTSADASVTAIQASPTAPTVPGAAGDESPSAPSTPGSDTVDTASSAPDETDDTLPPEDGAPNGPRTDPDGIGDRLFDELGNPGIDVVDMDVELSYDLADDTLAGSVTLTIDPTEDRPQFTLDSAGPVVSAVSVDGVDTPFSAENRELRITPADGITTGEQIVVKVDYTAAPDPGSSPSGLPSGWFHTEAGSYVLNEPDGARSWLPSNDHPSDKSTWTFSITVPTGTTAIANGELVSTTPSADGDTWVWRQDDPMATYLIQVLTGDYEIVEGTGPHGLPLTSVVLRADRQKMQPYLDTIDDQIAFYETVFGPYPLRSYGIAMTDSFGGLAMETQGRSTFSREDFSGSDGFVEELLLSHELAHQWFGDAVTLADWQDIWLNESFATYGEWLWLDHQGLQSLDGAAADALHGRRTQPGRPTGAPTAGDMFGFNSYEGGAVVLEALRRTVGDDAFFEILQRWVADHEGTSQRTSAFIALAEDVSGQDLTELFDDWLFATKLPAEFPTPATSS